MIKQISLLCAALTFSAGALAQVTVSGPWIRATVPQQTAAGAFMQLQSAKAARLVAVTTPVAARAEIHKMEMQGQTMRMQAVDGVDLPAGQAVSLASGGGFHLMLMGLKRQLKDGETVPLTLTVLDAAGKRDSVTVDVPVKPITFAGTAAH